MITRSPWPRNQRAARCATSLIAVAAVGCRFGFADPGREFAPPVPDGPRFPEEIHTPDPEGVWNAPLGEDPALPQQATCATCHGPNPKNFGAALPRGERFHTTIEIAHGTLTCDQCHDADRTRLHLADARQLDFSQVMTLCAQCHGPQYTDFGRGTHGGKNGYWETRLGPAIRNHCVDCHTPHAPAFEPVMPVLPPRDRFLDPHP